MLQGYGATETTLEVTVTPIHENKFGSIGKLLPGVMGKVRDQTNRSNLDSNQVGELCFKGPVITNGYYNNKEATQSSFDDDDWLLTGDLGYFDSDGYFYIVGRSKEIIKYNGFQVLNEILNIYIPLSIRFFLPNTISNFQDDLFSFRYHRLK